MDTQTPPFSDSDSVSSSPDESVSTSTTRVALPDSARDISMPLPLPQPLNISGDQTEFKKIEDELLRKIRAKYTGYLWFFNVTKETFYQLQDENSRNTRHFRYLYNFDERKLRIWMPARAHDSFVTQLVILISDKLRAAGLHNTACVPNLSPTLKFGNFAAQPDGCWGPFNSDDFTVCVEVANSQSDAQLRNDARRWLEHTGSPFEICLTVKVSADKIVLSVWRPQARPDNGHGPWLRRRHRSATITHTATIVRNSPNPTVICESNTSSSSTRNEIRLPVVAFTGYQLPPGINVNPWDEIILTKTIW
ncbi:hypothetical protein N7470_008572 [Penicillium chermesinum]|nr:hypothetical protein N7470_008572 [Penicillium chermesinum]